MLFNKLLRITKYLTILNFNIKNVFDFRSYSKQSISNYKYLFLCLISYFFFNIRFFKGHDGFITHKTHGVIMILNKKN